MNVALSCQSESRSKEGLRAARREWSDNRSMTIPALAAALLMLLQNISSGVCVGVGVGAGVAVGNAVVQAMMIKGKSKPLAKIKERRM